MWIDATIKLASNNLIISSPLKWIENECRIVTFPQILEIEQPIEDQQIKIFIVYFQNKTKCYEGLLGYRIQINCCPLVLVWTLTAPQPPPFDNYPINIGITICKKAVWPFSV